MGVERAEILRGVFACEIVSSAVDYRYPQNANVVRNFGNNGMFGGNVIFPNQYVFMNMSLISNQTLLDKEFAASTLGVGNWNPICSGCSTWSRWRRCAT